MFHRETIMIMVDIHVGPSKVYPSGHYSSEQVTYIKERNVMSAKMEEKCNGA